ncbi:MAG: hypothetical protein HJJLKODD_02481 [Phycisphaerae bacterium]|nr:hypothetical protein [Phycisphaerae bacterium]
MLKSCVDFLGIGELVVMLIGGTGCRGPLEYPMVTRLSEEQQWQVDEAWGNMLDQGEEVDRVLWLDVMIVGQLYEQGVDTLVMQSTKTVSDGKVVMTIQFNRAEPQYDEFNLAYYDDKGQEIRRERYLFDEVRERIQYFASPPEIHDEHDEATRQQVLGEWLSERNSRAEEICTHLQPWEPAYCRRYSTAEVSVENGVENGRERVEGE